MASLGATAQQPHSLKSSSGGATRCPAHVGLDGQVISVHPAAAPVKSAPAGEPNHKTLAPTKKGNVTDKDPDGSGRGASGYVDGDQSGDK